MSQKKKIVTMRIKTRLNITTSEIEEKKNQCENSFFT